MIELFIPSPPWSEITLGPVVIRIYALCLLVAIAIAWIWTRQRVVKKGGDGDLFDSLGFTAVISGIIGARIYHVVTEWDRYFGADRSWLDIFKIWNGGIGIIGAITGGALGVWIFCRIKGIPMPVIADAFVPGLLAAQAFGRLGNWFNQEVFGSPTQLPWALEIDLAYRPSGYAEYETFHPAFLYEGLWNLLGIVVLFLIARGGNFGRGKLFTSYVLWYTFGRFFIELIRIDPVNTPSGIRVNNWATAIIFGLALLILVFQMVKFPGGDEPLPLAESMPSESGNVDSATKGESDTDGDDKTDDEAEPVAKIDEASEETEPADFAEAATGGESIDTQITPNTTESTK